MKFLSKKLHKQTKSFWNALKFRHKKREYFGKYSLYFYYSIGLILFLLFILLNITSIQEGKFTLKQVFQVLLNWNDDKDGIIHKVHFTTANINHLDAFQSIQKGWFSIGATMLAGLGMTLAAVATQSLTNNPIAEGSTLGLAQAGIFGVVLSSALSLSNIFSKYLFIALFASIAAILLLVFIAFLQQQLNKMHKLILVGLILGIIFKTLTFLLKSNNVNNSVLAFAYVLGGAETIIQERLAIGHDAIPQHLLFSSILIFVGLFLAFINIKGLNLLEAGEERASNLGLSLILSKFLNVLIVLLVLPATIILVGNIAFLGLFSLHLARWFTKSRNYRRVLPFSLVLGMTIAMMGLQLTSHFPNINSGLWMTFIGAPYLIYVGVKGLR